jgi:hypothetical protein
LTIFHKLNVLPNSGLANVTSRAAARLHFLNRKLLETLFDGCHFFFYGKSQIMCAIEVVAQGILL